MTALYSRKISTIFALISDSAAISSQNFLGGVFDLCPFRAGMERQLHLVAVARRFASPPQYHCLR
jgi:hypothetical protein